MGQGRRGDSTILSRGGGEHPPGAEAGVDPGTVVAGYRVESLAGAGGMGVVYRAADPELGRPVALKLIAPRLASDPRFRELFVRESLIAAGLEHPNVIPIYRAGEDEGRLFIAMRYVEGASLADLIAERGRVPPGRAARVVARVAGALDAAHARGLVHRDVKPANVLIADPDGDEHVYLTDFGLSVGAAVARGGEPGTWAGTLAYLAPEQIRGGRIDAQTDVYALGCVLFHALTGRPPFPTHDEAAALEAHLTQAPPRLVDVAPGLPPALDEVVRRAMAKRPEDRFETAGELGRAALAARYDVAILRADGDAAAASEIAARLEEAGLQPLIPESGNPRAAAEGVGASSACIAFVGREGLGDWAREGLAAAKEISGRDRAFRKVLVLLPGGPEPVDPSLVFLATNPWIDLRAGVADPHAVDDLIRVLRGADVGPGLTQAPADACPYRGLEAFREEDADLFFGREEDVSRLVERLRATRFLAILGASGSGKSSVVAAGLVPAIRRGALPGGTSWRVLSVAPGPHPLAALAACLRHLPGSGSPSAADLAADERSLDLAVARAVEGRPAEDRVLVVVDQLEEAFTLCQDAGERAAFLGNLVYAASIPGGRTVVVVAMRADFYARLAEHPELRFLVAAQQVLLGPLDARGLRRAIEQPAARAGLELEPGLTRRILTDVSDRPGTLPLMEHLLLEVWQRRRGRTLTLEAYAASGGVEGALARRANAIYGAMSPGRQAVARRVLLRLTQPGEGTEDTRRRAERRELVTRPGEEGEVDGVVASLAEARLVTTGRDEASGQPVVDVTHEALIRGWPELRGWINDDREQLRLHRRLSDAAADWDAGGRDDGQLYRGAPLAVWEGRDEADLNELERGFLTASRDRIERERATKRRRTRITIGVLSGIAAIIAAIAVFAFVQRNDAADQRDVAQSRQIAASSRERLSADPEQSLLLAQDAYDLAPTAQAEEALRQATTASRVRFAYGGHTGPVRALAAGGSGGLVASAGDDGTIQIWDPREPGADGRVLRGHDGAVNAVAIGGGGDVLVSGGSDGTVRVWSVGDGRLVRTIEASGKPIRAVAVTPDGRRIAAGGGDGAVRVWGASADAPLVTLRRDRVPVRAVALSPDGRLVASGGEFSLGVGDVFIHLWNVDRGRLVRSYDDLVSDASGLTFTPDGRTLVGSSLDNTIFRWDVAGRKAPVKVDSLGISLTGVSLSPDGRFMAGSGVDGAAQVWPARGGEPLLRLPGHDGEQTAVAFVPGTSLILTAGTDGFVRGSDWSVADPPRLSTPPATTRIGDDGVTDAMDIEGQVFRWDPASGRRDVIAPAPPEGLNWGALGADGEIARSLPGRTIVVRRAQGGETVRVTGLPNEVYTLWLSADGRWLAAAIAFGGAQLWDTSGDRPTKVIDAEGGPTIAVSPGGAFAVGSADGTVQVWEAPAAEPRSFEASRQQITALAFTPDGQHLAVGSRDGIVEVWPTAGGDAVALLRHTTVIGGLEFSADGRLLGTAASDETRVWDWSRGIALVRWADPGVSEVHLGEDGLVLTNGQVGATLWTCDVCGPVEDIERLAGERVTRTLTADERREFASRS